MPFINVHTNVTLSEEQKERLKTEIGSKISLIPGKREEVLMLEIEDGKTMYFRGKSDGRYAMVTMNCFKTAQFEHNQEYVKALFKILEEQLGIRGEDAYVEIIEVPTWGVRGDLKN